jgi:hypothetical protein
MDKAKTEAESYSADRFGIQNHLGGIWTPETFKSAEDAQAFLDNSKKNWKGNGLDRHKVIPVSVTILSRAENGQ